ncbi:MAG: GNAT family N-acetyltransferase [Alloprevotella sp.]|nr:GNAT family N-acetyltransferase [Alloprevotella sp.]
MLHLRALEPEDLELLYTIENDPSVWDVTTPGAPYSHHALRQYLLQATDGWDFFATGQQRLVIETEEGVALGLADLFNHEATHRRAEVGIALLCEHRGKGNGEEALHELIAFARNRLCLHSLYAKVQPDNTAAVRLMQATDFLQLCTLPDWLRTPTGYQPALLFHRIL